MGKSRKKIFDGEGMGNCGWLMVLYFDVNGHHLDLGTHTKLSLLSFLMGMFFFLKRIPRKVIYIQHGILNSSTGDVVPSSVAMSVELTSIIILCFFLRTYTSNSGSQCSLSQNLSREVDVETLKTMVMKSNCLQEIDLTDCEALMTSICEVFSGEGGFPVLKSPVLNN
ncbi:hypothetical protein C5167_032433 [Papaver somniferum]|uniref:Uncharacterized protein n=1 Tax=Papaver somniferum TaxID=3469 RepID=A0A4Y7KAJ4_PAPSO|nr:hypothetical protein C5167_032433 [Papaver somniferum]